MKPLRFLIFSFAVLLFFSAANPTRAEAASPKAVKTVSVKIGKKKVTKKTYTLSKSKSAVQLKVSVSPSKAKKSVTYKSSNTKIATVSKKGKVTAKKPGTVKITITVKGKKGKKKSTWVKIRVTHKHRFKTPVKGTKTMLVPEPLSAATYPNGDYDDLPQWVKDKDITEVIYVVYWKEGFEEPINEYIEKYGYATWNSSDTDPSHGMIPAECNCPYLGKGYYLVSSNEDLEKDLVEDQKLGWAELVYTTHNVCRKYGTDMGHDALHYINGEMCLYSYTNIDLLKKIILHPSKKTTQTVTVGYKCNCGAYQSNE